MLSELMFNIFYRILFQYLSIHSHISRNCLLSPFLLRRICFTSVFFSRFIRWTVTSGNSGPTPDSLSMFHWLMFPSILRRWRGFGLLTQSSSTDRSPSFTKSLCPTNSSASTKTVPFYILKGKMVISNNTSIYFSNSQEKLSRCLRWMNISNRYQEAAVGTNQLNCEGLLLKPAVHPNTQILLNLQILLNIIFLSYI